MIKIGAIKVLVSECIPGIYLRWYWNGWHYFNFQNGYDIQMKTESMGTQVTRMFSVISKIERPTRLKAEYSYQVTLEGIPSYNIAGFTGLLMAEKVEQYEGGIWREVDITRGSHLIRDDNSPGYILNFEITRKELPITSSVFQKSLKLYIGDVICDLDDDEIIPLNKQVNDIAEMQDRQSDFTAQFKIRKTRAMRSLFELSGEAGINTNFPFEQKTCKLISDNIEIITDGDIVLDKVDDQYYYVAIYSGNKSFFKAIDTLKITDLLLPSTNHTWNEATMRGSQNNDLDYVYPLCEPSDDAGIIPMSDDGTTVQIYGGYIWVFIKAKAIWDEIFTNAGYFCTGSILTNDMFLKLHLPIVNREAEVKNISTYHYSLRWDGRTNYTGLRRLDGTSGVVTLINGSAYFKDFIRYIIPMDGLYKFRIGINAAFDDGVNAQVFIYVGGIQVVELTPTYPEFSGGEWTGEYNGTVGEVLNFYLSNMQAVEAYSIAITEITISNIGYGSPVTPHINLPDISQIDFIKMICNMFGLVPDVKPRDHIINFWNFDELYDNFPIARDWSSYLSERDDTMEFKFGEYAQRNYMRYQESEDVIKDQGMGAMLIEDETLPDVKDVIDLPISTCDEVTILNDIFSVNVSRINFNTWNTDDSDYDENKSIDPRIVYVERTKSIASPAYEKELIFSPTKVLSGVNVITSPKKASSLDISFSYLVTNYGSLSRLLTKTNLRKAKFNLPVYEVAGLKYNIPIYLSQYKAYFYVNKINNYVPGQLCTIDLIKL